MEQIPVEVVEVPRVRGGGDERRWQRQQLRPPACSAERCTATRVFVCTDLALPSTDSAQENLAVCSVFADEGNFHCQTCPRPSGRVSSSFPFQGFRVHVEFLQNNH